MKRYLIISILLTIPVISFANWMYLPGPGYSRSIGSQTLRDGVAYWWTANADTDTGDYGTAPTINGTVSYVTGQVGNAVEMNTGGTEYVSIPAGVISGASARIGFWLKWPNTVIGSAYVLNIVDGTKYIRASMSSGANAIHLTYMDGTTSVIGYGTSGGFTAGTWHFVEFVWEYSNPNCTVTTYIDGVSHGTATKSTMGGSVVSNSVASSIGFGSNSSNPIQIDNFIVGTSTSVNLNTLKSFTGAYQ